MKWACQKHKLVASSEPTRIKTLGAELTFRKRVGVFADIAGFLLAVRQPRC